eukprot:TRINITY_DN1900_c0_g1_i2.p1 TRINITY_DN1900_c0_g1~~TRINITY_DN1900_c0_g1_i2.p1  ORF type:complete len:304 (+),score=39.32 TRINITY_DN1900_c0_g1_i2:108-1019(+)
MNGVSWNWNSGSPSDNLYVQEKAFKGDRVQSNIFRELHDRCREYFIENNRSTSFSEENAIMNRYSNIHPYNDNYVSLREPLPGVKFCDPQYVNASRVPDYTMKSAGYIAMQGPTTESKYSTWQMFFDEDVSIVLMLTGVVENGMRKCSVYWPEEGDELTVPSGLVVKPLSVTEAFNNVTLRTFELSKGNVTRQVRLYHLTSWGDHDVTNVASIEYLVDELAKRRTAAPVVVHCSAGIGRTGTFIAIDLISHVLKSANGKVPQISIKDLVFALRSYREGMVQTPAQINLIVEVAAHLARKFSLQ